MPALEAGIFFIILLALTIHTHAGNHHGCLCRRKTCWQFHIRHGYIIQAKGLIAVVADKVHMVIVVVALLAVVFAKGI